MRSLLLNTQTPHCRIQRLLRWQRFAVIKAVAHRVASCAIVAVACGTTLPVHATNSANNNALGKPIIIQFSHVVAADTPKGKAAQRFKELAEARTGGRVQVEVYPNSGLYQDREELEALRLGAVQMLAPSLSKLAGVGGSEFEVYDLPFLFRSHADFRKIADGPIGQQLLQQLEPHGFHALAYWDNGFKVFTARQPLEKPDDLRGLKVRVQASRTLVSAMRQLDAEPSVSTFINVHDALQSGKLDGQENTPVNIYSQQLHQVQPYLLVSNHSYLAYAVLVNKTFWNHLPPDIRATLEGAMRDATAYENSLAEIENTKALERIQASGKVTVMTPNAATSMQWEKALAPVYQSSQPWIPKSLVDAIKNSLAAP